MSRFVLLQLLKLHSDRSSVSSGIYDFAIELEKVNVAAGPRRDNRIPRTTRRNHPVTYNGEQKTLSYRSHLSTLIGPFEALQQNSLNVGIVRLSIE